MGGDTGKVPGGGEQLLTKYNDTYINVTMKPIVLHAKVKILIIKKHLVFVNVESH